MPEAFQTTFANSKTSFDNKLTQFTAAEQANTNGAQTKIDALNNIHTDLMEMALDGQEIFKNDEATKKQFIFEQVLKLYAGNGAQGYKGKVITSEITGAPIKDAKITVLGTVHSTLTNAAGLYQMQNVAHANNQTITAEHPNFQTKTIPGNSVAIGVMSTLDFTLTPNA